MQSQPAKCRNNCAPTRLRLVDGPSAATRTRLSEAAVVEDVEDVNGVDIATSAIESGRAYQQPKAKNHFSDLAGALRSAAGALKIRTHGEDE